MSYKYDLFISHASSDKQEYVLPLSKALRAEGVSVWLDSLEIEWGDSVTIRINNGLRQSRFVLVCLSRNFIRRSWPEAELSAILSAQNSSGQKRVLPLILDAKSEIVENYPLLAAIAYREFGSDARSIARDIAPFLKEGRGDEPLTITFESAHTGQATEISASPRASIKWLAAKGREALGVSEEADAGGFTPFRIRWVLVDARARDTWKSLPRSEQRRTRAIVITSAGPVTSHSDADRLEDVGIYSGVSFYLAPVENEKFYEVDMGDPGYPIEGE